ncbi:MAG TPA: hypothetical protein VFZ00_00335 [Solirubrobacter sp.]|nr:hypothetical protein [Solirubrobacter sp.]
MSYRPHARSDEVPALRGKVQEALSRVDDFKDDDPTVAPLAQPLDAVLDATAEFANG